MATIANLTGGKWFSLPARGEGATWAATPMKRINQTCLDEKIWTAVQDACPAAFASCPRPLNQSTKCFVHGFYASLTGMPPCKPMTLPPLLGAWSKGWTSEDPNEGGCPSLPLLANLA